MEIGRMKGKPTEGELSWFASSICLAAVRELEELGEEPTDKNIKSFVQWCWSSGIERIKLQRLASKYRGYQIKRISEGCPNRFNSDMSAQLEIIDTFERGMNTEARALIGDIIFGDEKY